MCSCAIIGGVIDRDRLAALRTEVFAAAVEALMR